MIYFPQNKAILVRTSYIFIMFCEFFICCTTPSKASIDQCSQKCRNCNGLERFICITSWGHLKSTPCFKRRGAKNCQIILFGIIPLYFFMNIFFIDRSERHMLRKRETEDEAAEALDEFKRW